MPKGHDAQHRDRRALRTRIHSFYNSLVAFELQPAVTIFPWQQIQDKLVLHRCLALSIAAESQRNR